MRHPISIFISDEFSTIGNFIPNRMLIVSQKEHGILPILALLTGMWFLSLLFLFIQNLKFQTYFTLDDIDIVGVKFAL
jgi:hypothetical protein